MRTDSVPVLVEVKHERELLTEQGEAGTEWSRPAIWSRRAPQGRRRLREPQGRPRRRPQRHAERSLGRGRAETQPCSRTPLRPWGPRTRPGKEAAPTLAVHRERGLGAGRQKPGKPCPCHRPSPATGSLPSEGAGGLRSGHAKPLGHRRQKARPIRRGRTL